ncbi:MAG: hypothetical protein SOR56_01290 [Oscillospiraceae bacterium]|nr:hypothetical protein [Oscillospiraceae bacterium]
MDKFTIKRVVPNPVAFRTVQIRVKTYDMIKQMQDDTGASLVDLVDAMVRFCAERLDIEE